jgi:glycosyltransferase involved in cell wall biosynthesis
VTKILLVANTDWYLYNFRLSLAKFLCHQGVDVVMVSPSGRYVESIRAAGFPWVEWPVERRSVSWVAESRALLRLRGIYHFEKPDLVHHFTIKPVLYGSMAARWVGVPAIVNAITGLGYLFLHESPMTRLLRGVVMLAYRFLLRGDRVFTIFENESNRQFFILHRLVQPEQTTVIEGVGVDAEHFVPAPEPSTPEIVVLFPARLLREKGVDVVVEAARQLRGRYPVRFVLAGEPDPGNPGSITEAQVRAWEAEGLVEWWGWQTDMVKVYHQSHIVVLPSLGEGIPTALLEAGACARPVVTTDVPGCRDVVIDGENGLLVPPNDPQALAKAIEQLLRDPQLRLRLGQAGRARVLERFTDDRINHQTWAVYRRLLVLS